MSNARSVRTFSKSIPCLTVGGTIHRGRAPGTCIECAVVVTITVAVMVPAPLGVNVPGLTVQFAAWGAPWHVTLTIWLNPPVGVTLAVKLAGCPAVVLTEPVDVAIEKFPLLAAEPAPVRLTNCGLPVALSVIFRLPARVPVVVGVNVTLIAQFPPAANELPQLLVSA